MKLTKTCRGFKIGEFSDINGDECSIQESSVADRDCLWLGCNSGNHHMGECSARMHLDKRLAKQLIKHLTKFVETGTL